SIPYRGDTRVPHRGATLLRRRNEIIRPGLGGGEAVGVQQREQCRRGCRQGLLVHPPGPQDLLGVGDCPVVGAVDEDAPQRQRRAHMRGDHRRGGRRRRSRREDRGPWWRPPAAGVGRRVGQGQPEPCRLYVRGRLRIGWLRVRRLTVRRLRWPVHVPQVVQGGVDV